MRPDIFSMAAARKCSLRIDRGGFSVNSGPMRQIRFDFVGIRQDASPAPLAAVRARVVLRRTAEGAYDLGTHESDDEGRIFLSAPPRDRSGGREYIDIQVERTPFQGACIGKIEDEKVWSPLPGVLLVEALPVVRIHVTQLSHA